MSIKTQTLSASGIDVLRQLFISGPTWDGNVSSKTGRGELVAAGLAQHGFGWAWLTEDGVRTAVEWYGTKAWADQRWYRKQQNLD